MNVRELTDVEVSRLIPGLTIVDQTVMREGLVFRLLRAAVEAELFAPYLVMVWRVTEDDPRFVSVALTVNMGGGVQLCGPVWGWEIYTAANRDGSGAEPVRGVQGARRVLEWAERCVRTAVGPYESERGK